MASPVRQIFKVSRKTFFNPSAWIDLSILVAQTQMLRAFLRNLFVPPTPEHPETFVQAMKRLKVSEASLRGLEARYRLYSGLFAILGLIVVAYSFYLLFRYVQILDWLLGISASLLFFSQAFRFDFWAFQIKHRKLGCTFAEWKSGKVSDKGKPK